MASHFFVMRYSNPACLACAADRSGFSAKPTGPLSVATKHNHPQVKPVVFESRSLVLRFVQVSWLKPQVEPVAFELQPPGDSEHVPSGKQSGPDHKQQDHIRKHHRNHGADTRILIVLLSEPDNQCEISV
jgi:hypothetical protein